MRKDIEENCSTWTVFTSSGKNLNYQLPMTEKISLPLLTESGREIQINFSGKSHSKHVAGGPYTLVGNDQYNKWPVV